MNKKTRAIFFAVLAAALYAINSPISKLLLEHVPATLMASFLYFGAGIGLFGVNLVQKATGKGNSELPLTKKELPYTVGMVVLDIAAPIFLMLGLTMTTAANASLLNNFEIVATAVIALVLFKEAITKRLWAAILCVTVASILLSFEDMSSLTFSTGSLFVLLACVCWGLENNFTRMLSSKSPIQIVIIKGLGSGAGSLALALAIGERFGSPICIIPALLLGFVAYGLSIFFYIYSQRDLGAAKTSAYYAISPFIGTLLSLVIFRQLPSITFIIALAIMILGAWLATEDTSKEPSAV